ncbi:MAG: alpha-xenorhabdolysin family binary toxin subunit A [Lysobacter sp.]|nr:alpha-xenorhabdolysin family binary toxin subunit A [Lysobacter sp.]MDQ3269368.1 alpha-xenorhabdolysin family binary toxin subunit A [Pseudomonadota bacterium]
MSTSPSNVVPLPTPSSTTLEPPTGLVLDNPSAAPGSPPLFVLFTSDWLDLQSFIATAVQLPVTQGDFESKYGTFQDEQQVKDVVTAMKAIQALSQDFGDPTALIAQLAQNPAILQTDTAPAQVYTHIVWFATKLFQAAQTFNQTFATFMDMLNPKNCGSPAECGAILTQVLTGPGGLQSTAADMVTKCNDLVAALAAFNLALKPSTDELASYTSSSGQFYIDVQSAITQDISDVATYQQAADDAYSQWKDYTIAAVTTSVGLMVLTGGAAWPFAAIAAGVLGDKATKARDAYNAACDQVHAAEGDEAKKIQLKVDLDSFNKSLTPVNTAATNFMTTLQQVTGIWMNISSQLDFIVKNFTPEQLGNLPFVIQALKLHNATSDWQIIGQAAQQFTANSLVTYHLVSFGTPIPAQQAA